MILKPGLTYLCLLICTDTVSFIIFIVIIIFSRALSSNFISGAVAGLVDKPMQKIINKESTIHAVSGVVSGISQGMLGVVTKPIGGAAEFVAQAGQGFSYFFKR